MQEHPSFGMNKTGVQMSPIDVQKMLEATENSLPSPASDDDMLAEMRTVYIAEADDVGSVPVPGTARGMLKSGLQMLGGNSPQVLMDKLGERLAFERSGTRLYEAMITKCEAQLGALGPISLSVLQQFHAEEAEHFQLVADAIHKLGGDPTSQTPSADIAGVESMGLMQVLTDPRTSICHCLHALLTAEMVDNAGWELLIELAEELGQDEIASSFRAALEEEDRHLAQVRTWHEEMTLDQAH